MYNEFIDLHTGIMFSTSQKNPLSHFGIAGIHGMPFVSWEGAGGNRPVQGSGWSGYCTHGNVLFPTWHRPYVALYEVGSHFTRSYVHDNIDRIISNHCSS